jgi:hypothetical protein
LNKDEILQAVRHIAAENGGTPPGKTQFARLTGVKEWEWSGKYWAKWSDALKDAGLSPNEMNAPLSDEHLLAKYASFTTELGRTPTSPELRMRRKSNPDFPSHNTFAKFGNKKELLGALLAFCKSSPAFHHLIEVIEREPHETSKAKAQPVEAQADSAGYVYLIQFGKEYKIGNANNVERRFRELKTQMPYEGKIIHTILTGDPEGIEAYWHQYFADKRLKGEWFALSPSDVKYFRRRKLM